MAHVGRSRWLVACTSKCGVHDHTSRLWRFVGTAAFGHFLLDSQQCHGHGSWLVCEVGLIGIFRTVQWSGRCLGINGWDACVCKSSRLHVCILWFSFNKMGYNILWIPLKWLVIFLHSWTSTGYFNWFSPIIVYQWTGSKLQMNRLSLRNNRLKFKTTGKLPVVLEEFIGYTSI